MRAVAEWLRLRTAAGAPPIGVARLHLDGDGLSGCDMRARHRWLPIAANGGFVVSAHGHIRTVLVTRSVACSGVSTEPAWPRKRRTEAPGAASLDLTRRSRRPRCAARPRRRPWRARAPAG